MKTLHLLRHAKAATDGSESDHERPLAARGERAAVLMGRWLGQIEAQPELVLCSSALRARQTLEGVRAAGPTSAAVREEDDLYLASAAALLERLRTLDHETRGVLLIGHNPGLHDLAMGLCGSGEAELLAALRRGLPTAGHCEIHFDVGGWSEIAPGRGSLSRFATPSSLV